MYRQGDLILVPINKHIEGAVKDQVLASGEDSGHFHQIKGIVQDRFLRLDEDTELIVSPPSQEWRHRGLLIPAGTYEVRIQREYTPAGARSVQD